MNLKSHYKMLQKDFLTYLPILNILQSLESGINNSLTIRRAHSEEMLSELDLNLMKPSESGREMDTNKESKTKFSPTNQQPHQKNHQNGGFSSTELEEEEDLLAYRYKQQGQTLCVSDIPRMRRNSDHSVTNSHSHSQEMRGPGDFSLQYEPHHSHEFDRNPVSGIANEFGHMSMVPNGHNSASTMSPLSTSGQLFLGNGLSHANSSVTQQQPGLMDIYTTQLNPDLCSLQSNDDADMMMTSSASLQLHDLHQYDQNQNLEVSSRYGK